MKPAFRPIPLTLALACALLAPSSAQEESAPLPFEQALDLKVAAGWVKVDGNTLNHEAGGVRVVLKVIDNPDPQDATFAKQPGLSAATFGLALVKRMTRGAGLDTALLGYDQPVVAGKPAGGSRIYVPHPSGRFISVHAIVQSTPKKVLMAAILTKGEAGQVNEVQAHHDAIREAYAMLREARFKR